MPTADKRRRVLLAWELGGGYGHLHRFMPIVDRLVTEGCEVVLAVQSLETYDALFRDRGLYPVAAPVLQAATRPVRIESWADLAFNAGYTTADAVLHMVTVWSAILRDHAIDLVVAEFAPGAVLAARAVGLPSLAIGGGWILPPPARPLPAIRFWQPPMDEALAQSEARLLDVVNAALRSMGTKPLANLGTLFEPQDCCLCSLPEVDHYAGRGPADYFGTIYNLTEGAVARWPTGAEPRCFAYLNGAHPALRTVLRALATTGWPTILHLRNGPAESTIDSLPSNVWLAPRPLRLDDILTERPIVICQGLNLSTAALVSGCRLLLAPEHLEQATLANRIVSQGLGLALDPKADGAQAIATLRQLADDARLQATVSNFAVRYDGYSPALPVDAIVAECLDRVA